MFQKVKRERQNIIAFLMIIFIGMNFSAFASEDKSLLTDMRSVSAGTPEEQIEEIIANPLQSNQDKVTHVIAWNDVIAKSNRMGGLFGASQKTLYKNLTVFLKLSEAMLNKKIAKADFQQKAEVYRVQSRLFEAGRGEIFPVQEAKLSLLKAHQDLLAAYQTFLALQSFYKANERLSGKAIKEDDWVKPDLEIFKTAENFTDGWEVTLPDESKLIRRAVREHTSFIGRIFSDKKETLIENETRQAFYTQQGLRDIVDDASLQAEISERTLAQQEVNLKAGNSSESELTLTELAHKKVFLGKQLSVVKLAQTQLDLLYATGELTAEAVFIPPYQP